MAQLNAGDDPYAGPAYTGPSLYGRSLMPPKVLVIQQLTGEGVCNTWYHVPEDQADAYMRAATAHLLWTVESIEFDDEAAKEPGAYGIDVLPTADLDRRIAIEMCYTIEEIPAIGKTLRSLRAEKG